jgi:hypothetical protein
MSPDQPTKATSAPTEGLSGPEQYNEIASKYWADEPDTDKLLETLQAKEQEFFRAYEARGLFAMARLAYGTYYGLSNSMGTAGRWQCQSIQFAGENGELLEFSVNEFRSFFDQIINMTCKNRPSFQAQAINTDFDSLSQVEAADSVVTYYFAESYGERKEKEVVKCEGLYGKAYTHVSWDPDGGPEIEVDIEVPSPQGPMPGKEKVRAGESIIERLYPWQVICEPTRSEHDNHLWRMIVPARRSKWEAMARYPLYAQQIEKSDGNDAEYMYRTPGMDPNSLYAEDSCVERTFYHARTAAMPNGRKVVYVNGVAVDDDVLPVDEIPVADFMSCELHGTSFGISDLWNMIPLDQMQSQVLSDIATNVESFSRPPLAVVEGTDIDLDGLANGQKILFIPPNTQTPEAIKFPTIPDASWKALELIRGLRQSISGLNAIARGDTNGNVTSGAHAALYSQLAVDAQAPRAAALDNHRERVGNILLQYLKRYAKHPQLVAIAGVDERSYMQSFTGQDLAGVHRVVIKTQNPMLGTQAGRMSLAELLRDWPDSPLKDPQQIIELVTSGQFKPSYSSARASKLRIRAENEALLKGPEVVMTQDIGPDGQPTQKQTVPEVPVLMTDNAKEHLVGHLEILCSPAAKDPKVKNAVLAHIMETVNIARNGDPYLAMLLGNPPPQAAAMPAGPGGGPPGGTPAKPSQSEQNHAQDVAAPPGSEDDRGSLPTIPKPAQAPKNAALGAQG